MNKIFIKNFALLFSFFLIIFSCNIYANDNYYGVSFSSINYDTGATPTAGTIQLDERSFGFKLKVGNMINRSFAMELFYADYGEASILGNAGSQFTIDNTLFSFSTNNASLTFENEAIGLNGAYFKPINNSLTFMARLGVLAWTRNLIIIDGASSGTASDEGNDLFYSLGFEQQISKSTSIIIEYEQLKFGEADVDSLAFALALRF